MGRYLRIDSPRERRHDFALQQTLGSVVSELTSGGVSGVPPEPVWDEMVTGKGQVRPHWQKLMGRMSPLDPGMLEDRHGEAVQLLRQHGATYAVYGDPQGAERPWPLDLLPLVISGSEWASIAAGVAQRARLFNMLLGDIYGPQKLLADGRLPPALLHANPRFLHPCWGAEPLGGIYLHFSAFDLARGPDGRWLVLTNRTQAPSGAGYALENRAVVGRVLADCIGVGQVQPLAPFFVAFRESLHGLLPAGENARVVLLTPGPYNETYFEHVYLARHLGITLVEGNDLTVRDRRVYLKTLSGLERVGVVLRRLDDDFCDPVEFRTDSTLGVAGLMEAVRAGTVVIANALGSGVLEASAFKPMAAKLAPSVIGEPLMLPDIPTWWCADENHRAYVQENIQHLMIKSSFAGGVKPVFGGALSRAERRDLAAKIDQDPVHYCGQEVARLSTVPAWDGHRLEPRPMILRVYVAAIGGEFAVMPGGLTRTAPGGESVISMQLGGGSKDSWITSATNGEVIVPNPAANVSTLPLASVRPAPGELPSRVADGLFWVARYAERCDNIVRLLRTLLIGVTDAIQPWRQRDARPILNLAAWWQLVPMLDDPESFQPVAMVQAALLDPAHPGGAIANFQRLINAARHVRDRLPHDCWRIFVALENHIQEQVGRAPPVRLLLRLEELITLDAALSGAVNESMIRDAGWRFMEIGKHLERAISLVSMMRGLAAPPNAQIGAPPIEERRLLAAILALTDPRGGQGATSISANTPESADSPFDRAAMLRAVLANETDPRSLVFQLSALADHLAALPSPSDALPSGTALVDSALKLAVAARAAVPQAIADACQPHSRFDGADPLRDAFAKLDMQIPQISDLLTQAYFTHALARSA